MLWLSKQKSALTTSSIAPAAPKPHPKAKGKTHAPNVKAKRKAEAKAELAHRSLATVKCTPRSPVVEVLAALSGAALTIGSMGVGSAFARSRKATESVTRLTVAVENIVKRLDDIHVDIKADRQATFNALADLDRRVTKIEARQ